LALLESQLLAGKKNMQLEHDLGAITIFSGYLTYWNATPLKTIVNLRAIDCAHPNNLREYVLFYGALAYGARLCGDLEHAQNYLIIARQSLSQHYDVTCVEVAAAHALIGYYSAISGEFDKGENNCQLARTMCEKVMSGGNERDRKRALSVYFSCTGTLAIFTTAREKQVSYVNTISETFKNYHRFLDPPVIAMFDDFLAIATMWNNVLARKYQLVIAALEKAPKGTITSLYAPFFRALMFAFDGDGLRAFQEAVVAFKSFENINFVLCHGPEVVWTIYILAQIFNVVEDREYFEKANQAIEKIGKSFPEIARVAINNLLYLSGQLEKPPDLVIPVDYSLYFEPLRPRYHHFLPPSSALIPHKYQHQPPKEPQIQEIPQNPGPEFDGYFDTLP